MSGSSYCWPKMNTWTVGDDVVVDVIILIIVIIVFIVFKC